MPNVEKYLEMSKKVTLFWQISINILEFCKSDIIFRTFFFYVNQIFKINHSKIKFPKNGKLIKFNFRNTICEL